jgi:hypothetical protein
MDENGLNEDKTANTELATANTLATAKNELATAKNELATTKNELATAEGKLAIAEQKYRDEKDDTLKEFVLEQVKSCNEQVKSWGTRIADLLALLSRLEGNEIICPTLTNRGGVVVLLIFFFPGDFSQAS